MTDTNHALNEWADLGSTALQWLKNIRDGVSTADEALANMEPQYERVLAVSRASVAATPPSAQERREQIARIIRCTVMGSTETASGISGEYDAADVVLALAPPCFDNTGAMREALDRLHKAVKALGRIGSNNVTLFEDSPLKSQEAYEAWTELNGAQGDAAKALRFKLLFDNEWLEAKIRTDPDTDCEAGSPVSRPHRAGGE